MQRTGLTAFCLVWLAVMVAPALAGPPYQSDDPEPTDYQHYEIYTFVDGTTGRDGTSGESGIDFNYGAAPNLQLTAVLPAAYDFGSGASAAGFGNVELAAKYRFLTQDTAGVDVAFFPRVFLPAASSAVGAQHASLFLPVWLEKDLGQWSTFGGGGCELNRGGDDRNFCQVGAVLARQIVPDLQLGLEIFHQTPDTQDGEATTSIGAGVRYDVTDNVHLLGYLARNIQEADPTEPYNWYASILFTF